VFARGAVFWSRMISKLMQHTAGSLLL